MAQMVHAPAFTPAAFTSDDAQGLRQDKGNRPTYDAQTVAHMLDSIESVLDNAEECTGLLPTLDLLSTLAGMHPAAWKPKFKGIVDLLVGWHVDQGTSPAVRRRIGDVLAMFSKQWPDATEFGQDLLDFFIKDIEGAMVDPKITDKSKIGSVSSLMSCFNIIARALIANASQGLSRLESIQSRAMTMLMDIGQLARTPKTVGVPDMITNDFILTLSQGTPSRMYTLQPHAIKVLLRQFENPAKSNSAWKEAVAFTKKILTMWRPLLHPMVTREVVEPTSALMQARWTLTSQSRLMQDILDVILLTIPEASCSDTHGLPNVAECPWEGIASEIEDILQILPNSDDLSAKVDLQSLVQDVAAPEQLNGSCNGHNGTSLKKAESASASTQLSNLTFDILVLVGLSRTQHLDADVMFRRLLKSVPLVPNTRLAIFLHALKEVSASRSHFVPDYFSLAPSDDIDQDTLLDSTLGLIFKLIRVYVSHWKALPNASKLCLLAWGADIFQAVQPHSKYSGTKAWTTLRYSLSSNLHQLIAIAGADEDEMIRGVIAAVFEQFIGAFGSMSLGPCLMAKMTDSVLSAFGSSATDDKVVDHDNRSFQDGDALQRLFHACQGKDILSKLNSESSIDMIAWEHLSMLPNSLTMLTYWSQWEAARYCMLSRLRTPFGGPQQTFDSLEKQLNALLQQEQIPTMNDNLRLTRLRDFLMFIDRLELQSYNASCGTALGVLPPAPRPSVIFFRTNKKVCEEWFSRIRSRVIEGAKLAGEFDIVIRQSFMLLTDHFGALSRGAVGDIMPWLDEFERVLVDLVEALVAAGTSDSISGLYVWCRRAIKDLIKSSSSSKSKQQRADRSSQYPRYKNASLLDGQAFALGQINLDWMNTAVLRAQYRYEHSAKESISLMESYMDLNSDSEVDPQAEFLCQGISKSLSGLCSYQQLQAFMDSIPVDTYTDQTMLWSDDTMAQSLKEYCAEDAAKSWRHLEEFYTRDDSHTSQDMLTFDHTNLYGQNFLFVSKVYQQAGAQPAELDSLRQRAFDIIQPSAEFLLNCGMEYARSAYIDSMMLNTPVAVTPMAVKEFMDFLSEVPEELKMNLLHKDLHQWVRLDGMVNLAKTQTTKSDKLFLKQANCFKFLLSKIARRSECHEFASNIPRTWEGTLSLEIRFEEAKAAMAKHDYTTALRASSRILQEFEHGSVVLDDAESMAAFQSKILLKLAKWSRSTKPALSPENIGTFEDILGLDHEVQQHSTQARIEAITSGCLQKAVDLGAHYRKTWFAFGTHHYKQGWGILDDLGSFRLHHPVAKAANESLRGILEVAGVDHAENHSKNIFCVFVKHCASGQPFDENTTYESIRSHVSAKLNLLDPDKTAEAIIDSFRVLLERILESYKLAINGYFRFLQFATLEYRCNQPRPKKITGEESTEEISQSAISDEITATLRLLRLLAKHGGQLYEAFHENLTDINVGPWTNIIPQLFARLDHPEKPVQSLIANLLCKIGEQSPQLIVFHCVVGANSAHNSAVQRDLLIHIGEFLTKSHPELVSQVQHLIRELERITVLWEEVWCKKIMAVIPELKTTLQELTDQHQGLDSIVGLGIEDKDAVMSDNYQQSVIPILTSLESLQESNANPETKHEKWFVSTYGAKIRSALDALRAPKAWTNLFEGLGQLKEIYTDLSKELSGTRILQLSDLSPELSSVQSSLIDIPSHISGITIQSFEQQVVVIPTKTKPKKLTLVGSDGKRYTYLFKGLEDLHLDERVMQLLRISNGMLQRDKESNSRHLSARHYAVVPLSDSSGMIQWVESTVSLYTIIAKWQHRELVCARWMTDDTSTVQGPQRATDIYHEKAVAALKKAGLPANHPRRQWPKSILLDVYHDMASETPADLLEREIWASSPTPAEWWRKSVMFARSTAVMSMIGYVIGLGDRHLDNILIDFTTGDLVHIDYNVCFEKGKRLRIPEVVPFRLTRNILTSFGVTGVEGNFRVGCEQTMKVMRKNKEILVTLLEAFVYDPLVDWQIEAPTTATMTATSAGPPGQGRMAQGYGVVLENESGVSTSSRSLMSSRRRLSNDSMMSTSSVSIRSTTSTVATTIGADSSKSLKSVDNDMFSTTNQQPQQQQQQQPLHQRNAYAVNILRRVRHKLEGRDFDSVNKFKVSEQVDRVIQEATNVENLANMYEGWTSWI
ncbi:Serine/threonine-protein kinase smg1 [Podila verticillata]|nr:Serine/threonine-protein kinase smg1 [Podila verticillata]